MQEPNLNTFSPTQTVKHHNAPLPSFGKTSRICVVGAGAFGGWTALQLLRNGFKVTLVDAWGAGNSRSSSGDETRVIRSTYGSNELYFQLNVRALELWKENERRFSRKVFHNSGVLWLCYGEKNSIIDDSIPFSEKYHSPYERLSKAELQRRFPLIHCADLSHAFFDSHGGYLKARDACQEVVALFVKEGGEFIQSQYVPQNFDEPELNTIRLADGKSITSEVFIFACGSWLPSLFPEFLSRHISCTKQEVYYFGVPAEHALEFDSMPVWIDLDGEDFYYGIAGNASRGFKIGVDRRGKPFNPSMDDRIPDPQVLAHARRFIEHRFPLLKNAPLIENRVCTYENSTTGNFIFDLHPHVPNVFVLGGGSGHGFKHGPALGELITQCIAGERSAPDLFRLHF